MICTNTRRVAANTRGDYWVSSAPRALRKLGGPDANRHADVRKFARMGSVPMSRENNLYVEDLGHAITTLTTDGSRSVIKAPSTGLRRRAEKYYADGWREPDGRNRSWQLTAIR